MMFSNQVFNAVCSFETQTLQYNNDAYNPDARITINISGGENAHAICTLFKLCNPSKEYDFILSAKKKNRENYSVILLASPLKAGKLVEEQFMRALKSTIRSFSDTLGNDWVPYTITEDSILLAFDNIQEEEALLVKDSLDDSLLIYRHLINQSGYKIACEQIESQSEKKFFDSIAGSKIDVEKCMTYFKKIGQSMQNEIK